MIGRRGLIFLGTLVVLLVPLFLAVPAHLRQDPLIGPLADRYHVGLFLVLTILLHRFGPLAGRLGPVIAVCLLLGGATEVLQTLAGRSATIWDWYQDALGVGLGACWIWWRRSGQRLGPLLAAVALLGLVAWPLRHLPVTVTESRAAEARFPLLDDFERPRADALWNGHDDGWIARVPLADADDAQEAGHVLEMRSDGSSRWPGLATRHLPWDWSGMTTLRLRCRLRPPSPPTMRLSVWIEDRSSTDRHRDYTLTSFEVNHEWRTLEIPLGDIVTREDPRPLALEEIQALAIFVSRRAPGPVVLQLDDLILDDG